MSVRLLNGTENAHVMSSIQFSASSLVQLAHDMREPDFHQQMPRCHSIPGLICLQRADGTPRM